VKLHSPAFEKALRAKVRAAVRASPALRQQARKAPKRTWNQHVLVVVPIRIGMAGLLALLAFYSHEQAWPAATQSAFGALWFMLVVIGARVHFLKTFYDLTPLTAFAVLPVPAELPFEWNWQRLLWQSWRPLADALALFTMMAAVNHAGALGWLAIIPLAALTAALAVACALWLIFIPMPVTIGAALPAVVPIFVLVIVKSTSMAAWCKAFFIGHCETFNALLPTGWVPRAFLSLLPGQDLSPLLLLLPAAALVASGAWALRRLRQTYTPRDLALWQAFGEPPAAIKESFNEYLAKMPALPGQTQIIDDLAAREFLAPPFAAMKAGWIERKILGWLTPRERAVLEIAVVSLPRWTRQSGQGVAAVAAGLISVWFGVHTTNPTLQMVGYLVGAVAGLSGMIAGLPLASGFNRAFQTIDCFGVSIPFVINFPVAAREFRRVAFKAAVVRGLAFTPVAILAGALLALIMNQSVALFAAGGLKCALLAIASSPWLSVALLAQVSNDTAQFNWRTTTSLMILGGGFIGLAGFGIAALFAAPVWSVGWLLLAAAFAFGAASLYSRIYDRRWFDLMQVSQAS